MLVGTYTAPEGEGLGIVRLVDGRVERLAAVDSPSWVTRHPTLPLLYAVAEVTGELVVVDAASGDFVQSGIPAGEAACHVRVADDGGSAIVACWGDGKVLRYTLAPDGRVADRVELPAATGDAESRAHTSAAFGEVVVTTDLGLDLVRVWRGLDEVQRLELPRGSGPRHVVVRGDVLYVDTEYSNEIVTIVRGADGMLAILAIAPARVGGSVEGDTSAEIALDPTGAWLTVGIRGSDVIASSRILPDGTTEPVAEAPCGGRTPRHHVHDGDGILVANQDSSTITRLPFDAATGAIGAVVETIPVGSPTFISLDLAG
jgi:6-phosphogluconolactonase